MISFIAIFTAGTVAATSIVSITGSQPDPIIWNVSNFDGFDYGFDGLSTEALTIAPYTLHGPDADIVIDSDNLTYNTSSQPKKFAWGKFGNYSHIVFMGNPYFTGYDAMNLGAASGLARFVKNATKEGNSLDTMNFLSGDDLSKILIDSDVEYIIATGDGLELKEGYVLNLQQVDLAGNKALLELTKDGRVVDTEVVYPGTTEEVYAYDELDLGDENNVPTIIVHVSTVFRDGGTGGITIEGVFQISDTLTTVGSGDEFGKMEVTGGTDTTIWMRNKESAISLSRNSVQSIFGDINFKALDDSILKFYPFVGDLDLTTPSLIITSPIDGATITTSAVTVSGTASSNTTIANVMVNGILATGTTNWNANITMAPGANTITAIATDTSGNIGTDSITITYTPTAGGSGSSRIWYQGLSDPYAWTAQNFAGFYYDINDNIETEEITIRDMSASRIIADGDITYTTKPKQVSFEFGEWGKYDVVGFMGNKYFAGYNSNTTSAITSDSPSLLNDNMLSKVLVDSGQKYTLLHNETFNLQEGYAIKINQIDVNGNQVMLEILKDGKSVDTGIINPTNSPTYAYEKDVGTIDDLAILVLHVDSVFQGTETAAVTINGLFQISDEYKSVEAGDKYGLLEVKTASRTELKLKNWKGVSLSAGNITDLFGDVKIKVADDSNLRFELITESTDREIRGAVSEGTGPFTWHPYNFEGFYYDLDEDIISETITIDPTGRTIDNGDLSYVAQVQDVEFKYSAWDDYQVIGFMAEQYFAGYSSTTHNDITGGDTFSLINERMLSKVLVDDDTNYTIYQGDTLKLEEGYELKINQLDINGNQAMLELLKDGKSMDTAVVKAPDTYKYEKDVGSLDDVPLVIANIQTVFAGTETSAVTVDGVFQISDNYKIVEAGTTYDEMEIKTVTNTAITMENEDDISLSAGKTIKTLGNINLKVADSDTLRFYPLIRDTNSLDLTIIYPTNGASVTTSSIEVRGTASDDTAVANVTVNGILATGTTNWIADVALTVGTNIITAIAADISGNTATDTITITYTPAAAIEQWNKTFGGAGSDSGGAVQQISDGGYIITGWTGSYGAGEHDLWLVKTNAAGMEIWNKTFGGAGEEYGSSVQQTSDGGYIITGFANSYGAGGLDLWLVKTDAAGTQMWNKTFGGAGSDLGYSVQQTSDGGYIITGFTYSYGAGSADLWLVKTDASGTQMWNETFGGAGSDLGYSVQQTSDGGYIITGFTYSYGAGSADLWLVKTDVAGTQIWNKTFGGTGYDRGSSVQQTSDSGFIITGSTESYGAGSADLWLVNTDASGTQKWDKTFGGAGYDLGRSIQQTSDGGYIITGYTHSYGAGWGDLWLVKVGNPAPENSIPLYPMWNYISFPEILDNATPEHVLDGLSIDQVLHYNASTGIWENAATFGEFKPRTAYAIRVSEPQTIVNLDYKIGVDMPALQLYEGWNSVGLVGNAPGEQTNNAEDAFVSIDDSYDRLVGPWISASGGYYSHNGFNENVYGPAPAGGINSDSEEYVLNRHEGHWIHMTSADLLE